MSNNLNEIELSNINNISQHNLLSLNFDNNYKPTSDNDNDENNSEKETENIDSKEVKTCKDKKERSFIIVPIHLLLHVILLSIFEIVLYFNYITTIENKVFYDKVKEFIKHITITDYINDPTTAQIINYELNRDYTNEYLYNIQNDYKASIEKRDDYNYRLEKNSYIITYILSSLFILYISCTIYKFKLHLPRIFSEHLVLMICIGLYEIWFFYNVILKYRLVETEELNYIFVSCLLKKMSENPLIHLNNTIINSCTIY